MKITKSNAADLAAEPGLVGNDLKVWLMLIDNEASAAELAPVLHTAPTNVAACCRRLYHSGWLDVAEVVGKSKRYTARSSRNPDADMRGQLSFP